jgi:hypothetical protein
MNLLNRYPDEKWDYGKLSSNPNITEKYILAHSDKDWDWGDLSANSSISIDFMMSHPELPWQIDRITWKENATIDDVIKLSHLPWDPVYTSMLNYISLTDILNHPELGLDISRSPNLTEEFIEAHPEITYNMHRLSRCKNISVKYIVEHPHPDWNWGYITDRATFDEIRNYPDLPWVWGDLAYNPNVPLDFIISNGKSSKESISFNINLTMDFIVKHPNMIELDSIQRNSNIKVSEILSSNINICYYHLPRNPTITIADVEQLLQRLSAHSRTQRRADKKKRKLCRKELFESLSDNWFRYELDVLDLNITRAIEYRRNFIRSVTGGMLPELLRVVADYSTFR